MVKKTLPMVLLAPVALLTLAVTPAACGNGCLGPAAPATEWFDVPWSGGNVRVALVRPADGTGGPHPVLFALPWGGGTEDLVSSFIGRYWATRPARRGYYVVAPAVLGSSLDDTADELIPAIFEWMDAELDYDPTKVALVGASNGGRGMFHAALAEPDRFATLLGLPGRYHGDAGALSVLVGKPVWLIVGEFDTGWREASEATVGALESQGVQTRLDVAANQGHVMDLGVELLLDGLDEAIRR